MRDDLARLTARREELESLLADAKEEPVRLHPGMAAHYRAQVANLVEILNRVDNRAEAAEILRSLVERITLTPNKDGKLDIDLHGDLVGILNLATNKSSRPENRTADLVLQVKWLRGRDLNLRSRGNEFALGGRSVRIALHNTLGLASASQALGLVIVDDVDRQI